MSDSVKKIDFTTSVKRLEEINTWFQNEEIDLDEGLHKLREGKELIKQCRNRLQEVENEFVKIKEEFIQVDASNGQPSLSNHKDNDNQDFF